MKTFQSIAIVMSVALACSVGLNLSQAEPIKLPKKPAFKAIKATEEQMEQSRKNLKLILLAMHNYESGFGHLPTDVVDADGKPLLSWRVLILRYLDQVQLYNQFKFDEPWDSEHNKPLSDKVVKLYATPGQNEKEPTTFYKAFTGPGTLFHENRKPTIASITDGSSNTCAVIEAGPAVPWAKPDDFVVDVSPNSKKDLPEMLFPYTNVRHCATFDGAVHKLNLKAKPDILKAFITFNGGEVISSDQLFAND